MSDLRENGSPQPVRSITLAVGIALASAVGLFSTGMILPALPTISTEFSADIVVTQSNMGLYFFGMILSQVFFVTAFAHLPRRRVLIGALLLLGIGSLLGAVGSGIEIFLVARLVQGLGAGLALVAARTIAGEISRGALLLPLSAAIAIAMGLGITVAPLLGGAIATAANWRYALVASGLLAVFGAILVAWTMPETLDDSAKRKSGIQGLFDSFGKHEPMAPAAMSALMLGASFAFLTAAPDYAIKQLGMSVLAFSFYPLLANTGYILFNAVMTRRLAHDGERFWLSLSGTLCMTASGVIVACQLSDTLTPLLLLTLAWCFFGGAGVTVTLTSADAMAAMPGRASEAATLLGIVQLGGSLAGSMVVVTLAKFEFPAAMGLTLLSFSTATLLLRNLWFYQLCRPDRVHDRATLSK